MDEDQLNELNKKPLSSSASEEAMEKKEEIKEEKELAEYILSGLAFGFIIVVCGIYLLHRYNLIR